MAKPYRWLLPVLLAGVVSGRLPAQTAGGGAAPAATTGGTGTNQLLVFVGSGQSASALGRDYGLTPLGPLAGAPSIVRFQAPSVQAASAAVPRLSADGRVAQAYQINNLALTPLSFVPNDPFYFPGSNPPVGGPGNTSSSTYPGQWHLTNQMPASGANDPSIDTRVTGAWNRDLTGTGVVIGIVDDAIQVGHPDLAPNVRTDLSRYFLPDGSSQSDPSPAPESGSNHGTAVAGIAAARGGNGIGGTGAAPLAGLAGIRTELDGTALLNAYTWHNGDIQIKNHSYGTTDRYEDASAFAALLNSTAADPSHPVIHVFAAGNGRNQATDDANTSMLANAPGVIAVAALGSNGKFASYSSFGASVFVTAPSNSSSGFFGTATTDRTGSAGYNVSGFQNYSNLDYTNNFGGTSSAAPLASGIIALAVQARNDAGYATDVRVIRHLLAMTSRVVDTGDSTPTSDGGWRTNAAGFHFNQNYGFGLIDADALTRAAVQYSGVTPQVSYTKSATVAAAIPDVDLTGISRTFTVANSPGKLEEVLVTLHVTHALPGQLRVSITSPSHYTSRLVGASNASTPANLDWTFETLAFWGEGVNGDWTITVSDQIPGTVGTWDSYSVTFNTGELIPVPEPAEVLVVAAVALGIGAGLRRGRKLRAGPAAAIAP